MWERDTTVDVLDDTRTIAKTETTKLKLAQGGIQPRMMGDTRRGLGNRYKKHACGLDFVSRHERTTSDKELLQICSWRPRLDNLPLTT